MSIAELRSEDSKETTPWQQFFERVKAYECPVLLCPEKEGGFSVHALTLPGAVSEGETEAEALANIREALESLVSEYARIGRPIPWGKVDVEDVPKGAKERWILVNA